MTSKALAGIFSVLFVTACVPETPVPDTTKPTLAQVTAVPSPTTETTPNYTFSSTEAGTITYGGSCSSATSKAVKGNNTVTFNTLAVGSYSNCTIKVKDAKNNQSKALAVTPFDVAVLYTVTVNIPDSFLASRSAGRSANAAASFVVTEIDPATGKVTKEIPINNASQNGDGTWGVNVTTNPNAATVLIVSKNNHAPTVCINCALPQDAVYAPLTDTEIQVDVVTTVALDETIGIPVPMTLDEMDNLMDGVAPLVTGLPAPGTGQTLNEYLDQVAVDLETEIDNAFSGAETDDDYDSVLDVSDTFPSISLGGLLDSDGDGIPNVCNAACEALGMYGEDIIAPTIVQVTAVPTPTTDTTPGYTFSSNEAGTIIYGGACSSTSTVAISGNNTITFNTLAIGSYSDCTIRVMDANSNLSNVLAVSGFTIETGHTFSVSSILPSTNFTPGTQIKISGSYLNEVSVTINGTPIAPTVQNAHEFQFVAPSLPAGDYTMSISNSVHSENHTLSSKNPLQASHLDAGGQHACAVQSGGSVYCWGYNGSGQLGNGTGGSASPEDYSEIPVAVSGITTAIAVSTSSAHSCALLSNGTIKCWGWNNYGQLGNGGTAQSTIPVTVSGISTAVAISTGGGHSCAILASGSVKCWGRNNYGQLGNSNTSASTTPVAVSNITTAIKVSGGGSHTCVIVTGGEVMCWGLNEHGELGDGTATNSSTAVTVSGITTAIEVSGGAMHNCAVLSNGSLKCWGYGGYGLLGNGGTMNAISPVNVIGITTAIKVSSGYVHSCAVLADGLVKCWGDNSSGQLGDGSTIGSLTPVSISGISNAVEVHIGGGSASKTNYSHSCAQLSGGQIKCWGSNEYGQMGNGSTVWSSSPVSMNGTATSTDVGTGSSGRSHSCSAFANGTVKCWGLNDSGQLGNGTVIDSSNPVTVTGIDSAVSVGVSSGDWSDYASSCAMLSNGSIQCWGDNSHAQLGDSTTTNSQLPVSVFGITNAISLGVGRDHACALLSTGSAKCWGRNSFGQVGKGFTDAISGVAMVSGISTSTGVSSGAYHSCALLSNGSVQCWGDNSSGQLGNGTFDNSATPVTVSGINTAIAVNTGGFHSCAVLSNGIVKCWGYNEFGQLGNGAFSTSSTPVAVSTVTNAMSVSSGIYHSCAYLATGEVQCWGRNREGQLGNGTTTNTSTPISVGNIQQVAAISAGGLSTCILLQDEYLQCWGEISELEYRSLMTKDPAYLP